MFLTSLMRKLETADGLDPMAEGVGTVADAVLPEGPFRDALQGKQLGHPLHPALVALPIGMQVGVVLLDLLGDERHHDAARLLQGAALVATVPTAFAGLADFASVTDPRARRVGVMHAAAVGESTIWYTFSFLARTTGHHRVGAALSLLASAALGAGGYLGGHLAYAQGVGVRARLTR